MKNYIGEATTIYTLEANEPILAKFSNLDDAVLNGHGIVAMYRDLLKARGEELWEPENKPVICEWVVRKYTRGAEEIVCTEWIDLKKVYSLAGIVISE